MEWREEVSLRNVDQSKDLMREIDEMNDRMAGIRNHSKGERDRALTWNENVGSSTSLEVAMR